MTDSRWKNLALEVIGCFVSALGLYSFAVAAGVPVTGVAGIGAILFRLFGLPIGVTNIIMNIPIVLICFKYLGKDFFFRSVRCMVLFAIFTDYVLAALPVYQGDRMLATICGGVISGVGDALIYMQNSSTGGLDFITMAIKSRHPHMPFGNLTFAAALAVILANGLVFHDVDSIILRPDLQFFELLHHQPDDVRFQRLYDGFDCDERRPRRVQDDRRKSGPRFHDIERLRRLFPGWARCGAVCLQLQAAVYHQPRNQAH